MSTNTQLTLPSYEVKSYCRNSPASGIYPINTQSSIFCTNYRSLTTVGLDFSLTWARKQEQSSQEGLRLYSNQKRLRRSTDHLTQQLQVLWKLSLKRIQLCTRYDREKLLSKMRYIKINIMLKLNFFFRRQKKKRKILSLIASKP